MGEVGVHMADESGGAGERRAQPGDIGRPEALLSRPVQNLHAGVRGREPVRDVAGPVRRRVVHDQDPRPRGQVPQRPLDHRREVVGLVVGRDDEPDAPLGHPWRLDG